MPNPELEQAVTLLRGSASHCDISSDRVLESLSEAAPLLRCVVHPLGFWHFDVSSLVSPTLAGERIRIHYWPTVEVAVDELGSLHDHNWHLASLVVSGKIEDSIMSPKPSGSGRYEGVQVTYGSVNQFAKCGRFELSTHRTLVVNPGEIYRIPSRIVHASRVLQAPALTLVLARDDGRAGDIGPLIFTPVGQPMEGTAVRRELPVDKALREIARGLEASS